MRSLRIDRLIVFALPAFVSSILHGPINGVLPALYASEFGLNVAVIGAAMLIARIFDAVTDPLIGIASDSTFTRFGQRKPWIAAGAALSAVAIYGLLVPGEQSSIAYFLGFSLLLYLGWTLIEIPYVAWVLEYSRDTVERARINTGRTFFLILGVLIFIALPAIFPDSGGRMSFDLLRILAIIMVIAVPLTIGAALIFIPQAKSPRPVDRPRLSELWPAVRDNRPFQYFVLAYLFIGLGSGINGVLLFMYFDSYLGIGDKFVEIFLPGVVIGLVFVPVWLFIIARYGKYRTVAAAFLINSLIMPLPFFIAPGPDSFVPMLLYFCAESAFSPLVLISIPTILGDVIDFDQVRTGKNRAGQYNAFLALMTKLSVAIGGPIALLLVGLFGYQPGVENSVDAETGLRIVFAFVPPPLIMVGAFLFHKFPITDASQRDLQMALSEGR